MAMVELIMSALVAFVNLLFVPLDVLLGWLTLLGSLGALIAVGAITGFAVNLFQKYGSNQQLLGRRREDLKTLKALTRSAKDSKDDAKSARLMSLTSLISSKYALESLKPALYSIPPLCVLAMWVGARLTHEPVRPNDTVEVIGTFEDGASGFAYIIPNENLVTVGPVIVPVEIRKSAALVSAPPATSDSVPASAVPVQAPTELVAADTSAPRKSSSENVVMKVTPGSSATTADEPPKTSEAPVAHWIICAPKEGKHQLRIRHGDDQYSVAVPVFAKGGLPPEQATLFRTESPTRDRMLSLEFKLRDTVPAAWWNVTMQSMGVYFIAALFFGLILRRVMGIQ